MLGFRRLGLEVLLVEESGADALIPPGADLRRSRNAAYFRSVAAAAGIEGDAALFLSGSDQTVGPPREEIVERVRKADLLVNLSGVLRDEDLLAAVPIRLYVDLDPAFTQIWDRAGTELGLDAHTHFATVGQAIGEAACPIPTGGRTWIGTLPPIVLADWPVATEVSHRALTTVGHWRGYGSLEYDGSTSASARTRFAR